MRLILLLYVTGSLSAQFPFEKYPIVKFQEFHKWQIYDRIKTERKVHQTITVEKFFNSGDSLTIQLTNISRDSSFIRIYKNVTQIHVFYEPMYLAPENVMFPLKVADFDGNGKKDLKVLAYTMGNGLASLNIRIIYFFQVEDGRFVKISYFDKEGPNLDERDFDGDGKYEIMTRNLYGFENHNYWTYNLFDFVYEEQSGKLINISSKFSFPLMIQFLNRLNFEPTDKITIEDKKRFILELPEKVDYRE